VLSILIKKLRWERESDIARLDPIRPVRGHIPLNK